MTAQSSCVLRGTAPTGWHEIFDSAKHEIERLRVAKSAALNLADERALEAVALRSEVERLRQRLALAEKAIEIMDRERQETCNCVEAHEPGCRHHC